MVDATKYLILIVFICLNVKFAMIKLIFGHVQWQNRNRRDEKTERRSEPIHDL